MKSGEGNRAPSPGIATRHRWWLDIRWITAGVVALAIVFLLWGLFGPEAAIRISRETTFITEPLAADGLPDYAAAWMALAGPAPPPEENAAVVLLQTLWPIGLDGNMEEVCHALGIPNAPPGDPLREPHEDAASQISWEMFELASGRPWTGSEFPAIEAWLSNNQEAIDRIVSAANLPRFWLPTSLWFPAVSMPARMGNSSRVMRGLSRIVMCRALWHLGERRYTDAWRDIHAISRLARLMTAPENGPLDPLCFMPACALERYANSVAVQWLLGKPDVPRGLLLQIGHDIKKLGPPTNAAQVILGERIGVMSVVIDVVSLTTGGRGARASRYASQVKKDHSMLMWTSLDCNRVLTRVNAAHDVFVAAAQHPEPAEGDAMIAKFHQDAREEEAARKSWSGLFMMLVSRACRTDLVASEMYSWVMADPGLWMTEATKGQADHQLLRAAVALALWKSDHASDRSGYPERLEELVPRLLAAVPTDPYSGKFLVYERRGEGYLLASVGINGVYDGGDDWRGSIIGGEWQEQSREVAWDKSDRVIRMPLPEETSIPPVRP